MGSVQHFMRFKTIFLLEFLDCDISFVISGLTAGDGADVDSHGVDILAAGCFCEAATVGHTG